MNKEQRSHSVSLHRGTEHSDAQNRQHQRSQSMSLHRGSQQIGAHQTGSQEAQRQGAHDAAPPPPANNWQRRHLDNPPVAPPREHVMFIHGTGAKDRALQNPGYARPESEFAHLAKSHYGSKTTYSTFAWSGAATSKAREKGATELLQSIRDFKAKHPDTNVNLIAHSHGGNVAGRALQQMNEGESVSSVMLLGTPQFRKGGQNTVWNSDAIAHVQGDIHNVYSRNDRVQTHYAGVGNNTNIFRTAKDKKTTSGITQRTHANRRIESTDPKVKNINATNVVPKGKALATSHRYYVPDTFSEISGQVKSGMADAQRSRKGSLILPPKTQK
ncbi:alpha/beta fold hydrolase [Paraneptunicella aestuarii]|uniref:esterase/lipase family protein n=1 Tax=Paraneptunicella aestuarii TaxID=2831148 RepID=UPI001E4C897C|nr:alpha/beta fold hydrolase [Paraneptunicella aestuarii]UAA39291.1 alpha/beta fold hydrolase [Paraneptunicella aestuarii]